MRVIDVDTSVPFDSCPFCGNGVNDDGITQVTVLDTPVWASRPMWGSYVTCLHCAARGSHYYEDGDADGKAVAIERAYISWQTIQRSTWWQRNVSRPLNQLRYDIDMWLENRQR